MPSVLTTGATCYEYQNNCLALQYIDVFGVLCMNHLFLSWWFFSTTGSPPENDAPLFLAVPHPRCTFPLIFQGRKQETGPHFAPRLVGVSHACQILYSVTREFNNPKTTFSLVLVMDHRWSTMHPASLSPLHTDIHS